MSRPIVLRTAQDVEKFRSLRGIRLDWHEPDEQSVRAVVLGHEFDNAMGPVADGEGARIDMQVNLLDDDGNVLAMVNLATLFALASEAGRK